MKPEQPQDDWLAHFVLSLNLSGLTMTKVILWLVAITIVSFSTGIVILALSGGFSPGPEPVATPFNKTAFYSQNTTAFPLDGASSGEVRITLGTGDLSVRGGAQQDNLIETKVYSGRPEMQPDYAVSMKGSVKSVTMTETGHKKKDWVFTHMPDSWDNTWDVKLNDAIPFAMVVNTGAGDCDINGSDMNLTALTVNTGAGDTTVDLSGYHGGKFDGKIHNGVGDLTVRIDKSSNMRILLHQGVGDIDTRGIVQTDDYYTTAGFNPALPVNEIIITQGVGSIQLEAV
jgi:N-terminal domain of toast_rack, DUF2154